MFLNLSLENEVKCQPCIGQRLRTNVTHFRTIVTDKNEAEHRVYHFNFDSSELRTKLLFFLQICNWLSCCFVYKSLGHIHSEHKGLIC